jgi:toxin HigB-1
VKIEFANKGLTTLCSVEREQNKRLGRAGARKLRARLADLMAAPCVSELVAGHPHPLTGDRIGQFALDLDGGRRLVFEPAGDPAPRRDDGSVAWEQVAAVLIVYIGDYHD